MKKTDDQSGKIMGEHIRLKGISQDKQRHWQDAAKAAESDAEFEKIRPLFEDSFRAHKEWQEHYFKNARSLLFQKHDSL